MKKYSDKKIIKNEKDNFFSQYIKSQQENIHLSTDIAKVSPIILSMVYKIPDKDETKTK